MILIYRYVDKIGGISEQMLVSENTAAIGYEPGSKSPKRYLKTNFCFSVENYRGCAAYLWIDKKWSIWMIESEAEEIVRYKFVQRTSCVDWVGENL